MIIRSAIMACRVTTMRVSSLRLHCCTSVSPLTLREGIDIPLSFRTCLTLCYSGVLVLGRCCVVKLLRYATAYSGKRFGSLSPYNPDLR